jgi:hypothetical protein
LELKRKTNKFETLAGKTWKREFFKRRRAILVNSYEDDSQD